MQDPHVVALRYKVETNPTVTFSNPPAVENETDTFRLRLDNGRAAFHLKDHFPSVEAARSVIDGFIRAWEIDIALRFGRQEIKFVFEDAEIIDRNPAPPVSPQVLQMTGIASAVAFGTASLIVKRREYPAPPKHFKVDPDVDTLWHRFEGYTQGREPLLAMAYFCLTLLEARAGRRKDIEKLYQIHASVLSKLGELATIKGDEKTARKVKKTSSLSPLSRTETRWIEATIKAIIRRAGEIYSGQSLPIIILKDLPTL